MDKIILAGCVILKDNSLLLLNRIKTGWYELPGGKVDKNETPEVAAKRELKEELNVDIEIIKKIGEKDFEENGKDYSYIWFLAKIKQGFDPSIGEPEKFNHFKYIHIEELSNYSLSPNMKNLAIEIEESRVVL